MDLYKMGIVHLTHRNMIWVHIIDLIKQRSPFHRTFDSLSKESLGLWTMYVSFGQK
jgi:hypothetical protein